MSIDLDERLRRAAEIAGDRGVVALATEVDANGRAVLVDEARPEGTVVLVLADDARLVLESSAGVPLEVLAIVFERGVLRLDRGRFVLVEVEQDVSAREVREELRLPLFADASLVAFA